MTEEKKVEGERTVRPPRFDAWGSIHNIPQNMAPMDHPLVGGLREIARDVSGKTGGLLEGDLQREGVEWVLSVCIPAHKLRRKEILRCHIGAHITLIQCCGYTVWRGPGNPVEKDLQTLLQTGLVRARIADLYNEATRRRR